MPPILRIEGLSKRYRLGQTFDRSQGLRHVVNDLFTRPFRRARQPAEAGKGEFWALRDVSFNLSQGETLGIIGRNGAGKSTLLKILSRITEPTSGEIHITGRVASLLEVGTGFHGDLTGRENIFLNGAILGMTRAEIKRKFDEIVAFAEIENFIDTPVKRYSSGMYVRLAFSVAAHLEPEILVIDEVLAVGDTAFQKKCIGKMGDVSRSGRTILFVSHTMSVVQMLCSRAVMLQAGQLVFDDLPPRTIAAYLNSLEQSSKIDLKDRRDRSGKGDAQFSAIELVNPHAPQSGRLSTGAPARIAFHFTKLLKGMNLGFTFYDQSGQAVANFVTSCRGAEDVPDASADPVYVWETEEVMLLPGRYRINAGIGTDDALQDLIEGALVFDVEEGSLRGRPIKENRGYGSVSFPHRWRLAEPKSGR